MYVYLFDVLFTKFLLTQILEIDGKQVIYFNHKIF